jgi:malic enzyme
MSSSAVSTSLPASTSVPAPTREDVFAAHLGGKLSTGLTTPLDDARDLAIAYTPGVADVSRAIAADPSLVARYTWTSRLVAVVSDGTAVLGLGDIGPRASLPVMEGKSALFKAFGGLDSIPLVLDTTDVDEIVETLVRLRPSFGAVNLEDVVRAALLRAGAAPGRGARLPGHARRPARHRRSCCSPPCDGACTGAGPRAVATCAS